MNDLHIVLDDVTITCGNCDAKITPADADEVRSKIFRAGYYTCPNCSMNLQISQQTAEWGTNGVLENCLDNMKGFQW